jgi:tol-pal system protein YbgF
MIARLSPLLLALSLLPAHAGLFDDDEARKQIAEVRAQHTQRLDELQARLNQLDQANGQKLLELVNQLGELNQQIANLRGQIEMLGFNLEGLEKRQKDLYVDLDNRLRQIENGRVKSGTSADAAQTAQQEADAASAYEAANALFRQGKYKGAAEAFAKIAADYPKSSVAANALFWTGMSLAQAGDEKNAESAFRKLVDTFPEHAKSPDALAAIATLQLGRGDKKRARQTLRELMATYPGTPAAKDAEKQLNKL